MPSSGLLARKVAGSLSTLPNSDCEALRQSFYPKLLNGPIIEPSPKRPWWALDERRYENKNSQLLSSQLPMCQAGIALSIS